MSDAALDDLAFHIGLRLMGPLDRLRLRLTLARHPDLTGPPGCNIERLERLEALLDGRLAAETLQDRLDLAAVERQGAAQPFDAAFWETRTAALVIAGWPPDAARALVADVRSRIDVTTDQQEEEACSV